jgi:hypothetical protein
MTRGRLIFQFLAEVFRLDTQAMDGSDPDGPGPLESGYDPDFKEPVLVYQIDDGIGERFRAEYPPVKIPCQVETKVFEELRMLGSGNAPKSRVDLVFHYRDLERLQLVDSASGDAVIRPGDRLNAIYDKAENLVQAIRTPPGLYVTESQPIGFGLNMAHPKRNLLLVTFEDRQQGAGRA